jgi:hypothetical protein
MAESADCLLDPRRRCRQQAAQRVEAEVVDDLGQGLWIGRNATASQLLPLAAASLGIAITSASRTSLSLLVQSSQAKMTAPEQDQLSAARRGQDCPSPGD